MLHGPNDARRREVLQCSPLLESANTFESRTSTIPIAIEGNVLGVGETREVVELGLTITGKPLKDQAEARNLSGALDFLEELAGNPHAPVTENDVCQLHAFVLKGLSDEAGAYRTVPVAISGSKYLPPGPESVPAQMEEFGRLACESQRPDW